MPRHHYRIDCGCGRVTPRRRHRAESTRDRVAGVSTRVVYRRARRPVSCRKSSGDYTVHVNDWDRCGGWHHSSNCCVVVMPMPMPHRPWGDPCHGWNDWGPQPFLQEV